MMKVFKILIALINISVPILLFNILIIVDFLINGSGMQSTIIYEKYRYVWLTFYIILAILHLLLLLKKLKIHLYLKTLILLLTTVLYIYYLFKF